MAGYIRYNIPDYGKLSNFGRITHNSQQFVEFDWTRRDWKKKHLPNQYISHGVGQIVNYYSKSGFEEARATG
ncbi:MAG: hypothetical protein LBP92_00540 [Deltaproteobacteria bacterium]|jgi:hypothetical protein|nr:hypothetical protein [Deltaproteobacteria bacterium]